jgi:hypothetical protein
MNSQFKELAGQAGMGYLYDYDADGHAMVCSEKDIEKFAELIVRKCLSYAKDGDLDFMKFMIKKHFGVEE